MDIRLYNKVPVTIKKLSSYKSFKRELKYFLMNQVFYSIYEFLCYWLDDLQLHVLKFYMICSINWLFDLRYNIDIRKHYVIIAMCWCINIHIINKIMLL